MTDAEMRRLALEHASKSTTPGEPFEDIMVRMERIRAWLAEAEHRPIKLAKAPPAPVRVYDPETDTTRKVANA